MNIKILASLTISFLSIAASLFFFGVIAPQLISIIIAALTACLAAIFTTMIIAHVVQKQFQHLVYTGKLEHILPYINYGANVNHATNLDGDTPLHLATKNNHADIVLKLIQAGANINAVDQHGSTALYFAAAKGHTEIALALIKKGANPNAIDQHGSTALHFAAAKGHTEIALALIQAGANPNAANRLGDTPLLLATYYGYAAKYGRTAIAVVLIENGADVNAAGQSGNTPLHWAAQNGHIQILSKLIKKGANIHAIDQDGSTPLHFAAQRGHTQIAVFLIQAGTRVNATNQFSHTPLCLAVRAKRTEVAIELIKKGANINTNINNRSLLFWTIRENDRTTTLAIIHYGKVPYTNIPVIEGNPTSDYIQRQYQRAQKDNSRYAKRLFCCMQPDYGDIIRLQIQIWAMITKDTNLYRKIRILLRNALPTDLLHIVLQYAGLLPPNHHIDLNALMIPPCSSNTLLSHANPAINTTRLEYHNDMATYHNPSETGGAPSG